MSSSRRAQLVRQGRLGLGPPVPVGPRVRSLGNAVDGAAGATEAVRIDVSTQEPRTPRRAEQRTDLPRVGPPRANDFVALTPPVVELIHWTLVKDYANGVDPIDPPGVRDTGLLESALSRPETSLGRTLKYPTVPMAAAALLHAMVHNHPFHNGNKRTATVAMLVLLDRNGWVLTATDSALFDFVLTFARHGITSSSSASPFSMTDEETIHAARWILKHGRQINRSQRRTRYEELLAILKQYGCDHEVRTGNRLVIRRGDMQVHVGGYRNLGTTPDVNTIAHIRKSLKLDEQHGIDSELFFAGSGRIEGFIQKYRKTLDRLAPL